jgi:hypothetical protein
VVKQRPRKRYQRHRKELCAVAVERMKHCDNISALAQELGLSERCCTSGVIGWKAARANKRRQTSRAREGINAKKLMN